MVVGEGRRRYRPSLPIVLFFIQLHAPLSLVPFYPSYLHLSCYPAPCQTRTFFTMAVVIGMSVYVVHYKEFRFSVNGRSFVNDGGKMMLTDSPVRSVNGLQDLLKESSESLSKIQSISFFAETSEIPPQVFQTVMKVSRVDRFASGLAHIYGYDSSSFLQTNLTKLTTGKFTDTGFCKTPCTVVDDMAGTTPGRRLLSKRYLGALANLPEHHGRKLGWFSKAKAWLSGSTSTTAPKWKVEGDCPWICKQGWWWQSNAYGKPACCVETKDDQNVGNTSPYDTCDVTYDTCQCDASCRSCCDGN